MRARLPVGSAEDPAADIDPAHAAVRRHDAVLGDELATLVKRRLQGLGHIGLVLGKHHVPERRAAGWLLAGFPAEDAAQPVVPVQPVVDDVPVEGPQGGRGQRQLEPSRVDVGRKRCAARPLTRLLMTHSLAARPSPWVARDSIPPRCGKSGTQRALVPGRWGDKAPTARGRRATGQSLVTLSHITRWQSPPLPRASCPRGRSRESL